MKNSQKQNTRVNTCKVNTTVTIREDLKEQAKQQGLNLSRILEMELENRLSLMWRGQGRDLNPRRRLHRPEC